MNLAEARARENEEAMPVKNKAHRHEFIIDTRPGWGGATCRICGFRVPRSMFHLVYVSNNPAPTLTEGTTLLDPAPGAGR